MKCNICPRGCNIDRNRGVGACGATNTIKVAKIMLHHFEEPCISGENGSGAIFFSGCNLGCVYCQNKSISHTCNGIEMSVSELANAMLDLQSKGAHNINLVTPTHFALQIRQAIDEIRSELKIPVVYNTSGYELPSEIEKMAGYVDVFLVDIKYFSSEASKKYSNAKDYFEHAFASFGTMLKQQPKCVLDENGIMKRGVILRHLVLPTLRADSKNMLGAIADKYGVSDFKLSLMCQYTPEFCDEKYKELKRKITTFEYQSVLDFAVELGFDGYMQDFSSVGSIYTPDFLGENKNEIKNS